MTELLSTSEINARLGERDWSLDGKEIVREWELKDFGAAIAFVNRVAETAEDADHHPDILLHGWNKVRLSLSSHSAGGLTGADFDMAAKFDGLGG
jgi:4a-hydroxytetrahydrobiopterin dehydratase